MTRTGEHLRWPDIAKGVGIILVVFGHCWRGLASSGLLPEGALFRAVDDAIYAFHMPLFFFLSGWFFPATLARFGQADLAQRLLWRIFYPMCVWTYVFIALQMLAGDGANTRVGLETLLRWPIPGYLHLWFLWALLLIQGVALLLRPLALRGMTPFFVGMTVLTTLIWISGVVPIPDWAVAAARSAPFFFLGGMWHLCGDMPASRKAGWLALAAFVAVEVFVIAQPGSGMLRYLLIGAIALTAVLVMVRAAEASLGRAGDLLALFGQYSMTIYLMHTIFAAMIRVVLIRVFGIHALTPHLLLSVSGGLLLPLLIHLSPVPGVVRRVLGLPERQVLTLARPQR